MISFHQILVAASPGDAITNLALEIRTLLRKIGPSDIFAWAIEKSLAGDIVPLKVYDRWVNDRRYNPVLLYHASIGAPDVLSFMLDRREPAVLIYHNISPPEPFMPYDPAFAGILAEGRRELAQLKDLFVLSLADSTFNAEELRELGFSRVSVTPPIIDYTRLLALKDDPGVVETLNDVRTVLYVGQILPHKRPDLLIQSFHILKTYLMHDAQLMLVGASRLPAYRRALEAFVDELNIDGVRFLGQVSDEALATYYRNCDIFVTMSEHEGFCFPLVESMACGIPIAARDYGAVPETLGEGGLVLGKEESPALVAEAIHAIVEDSKLREHLIGAGAQRLSAFEPDVARSSFVEQLMKVV